MRLDSKKDNIRALQEGLFGNAPRQWQTMDDVVTAVDNAPIVVRPRTPGGRCWYEISVMEWFLTFCHDTWFDPADYYFNEPIDPKTVTLNAEITHLNGEVVLHYSQLPNHMRPALLYFGAHAYGLEALLIMRHLACDKGRDTIEELLELYPNHVIEFTCMTKPYGTLGWKTVIWEMRNY